MHTCECENVCAHRYKHMCVYLCIHSPTSMCLNMCTYVYRQVPAGTYLHTHTVHFFLRSPGLSFSFELLALCSPVLTGPEGICAGNPGSGCPMPPRVAGGPEKALLGWCNFLLVSEVANSLLGPGQVLSISEHLSSFPSGAPSRGRASH